MILIVKVVPNSKKNSIEGFKEGVLKVKIQAPPDKGKANDELIEFLAELLRIPKSRIQIISGQSSRMKKVEIQGETEESFRRIVNS